MSYLIRDKNYNYLNNDKKEEFNKILLKDPEELKRLNIKEETVNTFKKICK